MTQVEVNPPALNVGEGVRSRWDCQLVSPTLATTFLSRHRCRPEGDDEEPTSAVEHGLEGLDGCGVILLRSSKYGASVRKAPKPSGKTTRGRGLSAVACGLGT